MVEVEIVHSLLFFFFSLTLKKVIINALRRTELQEN